MKVSNWMQVDPKFCHEMVLKNNNLLGIFNLVGTYNKMKKYIYNIGLIYTAC